jgi:hypothetical protein
VSPVLPADGVSDLLVNVVSVSFGFVEVGLVDVGHFSQISDDSGTNIFVSLVLLVSSDLGLEILSLKISQ